ncbi:hypothetical protein GCM10009534_43510 [Kribbella sandramycini]
MPLAALAFLTALTFRPRAADLPDDTVLIHRDQAPTLFGLLDEIAAAVGTRSGSRYWPTSSGTDATATRPAAG